MDIREVGDWIGTGGLEVGIRTWIPAMKCKNLGLVTFIVLFGVELCGLCDAVQCVEWCCS
jgi:hypothetical protein